MPYGNVGVKKGLTLSSNVYFNVSITFLTRKTIKYIKKFQMLKFKVYFSAEYNKVYLYMNRSNNNKTIKRPIRLRISKILAYGF